MPTASFHPGGGGGGPVPSEEDSLRPTAGLGGIEKYFFRLPGI